MRFNLFENEEKVIEQAARTLDEAEFGSERIRDAYTHLLEAYRKSYREQRRLVKLSDRLQEQLSTVNQELLRRREEAERALRQLEETQTSLLQAEKMASLGALVAGVSHEINTPVGVTLTAASHLADKTGEIRAMSRTGRMRRSDFEAFIDMATEATALILNNSRRAAELIQSFKQVAADQTSAERRTFELRIYLHEVLLSLSPKVRQAGHGVVIECPERIEVDGFPGALSQVVTNFVMNSLQHAFAAGQAGTLHLSVRECGPGMLELRYRDDGCGIPGKNLPRIFDPFFTTRRGRGGTGLGLHIAFNIVTNTLKGQIAVDSVEGKGTSFIVTFPRVTPPG